MRRLLLSIGLTLLLAACQSASGTKTYFDVDAPREPIKPGQTRITYKSYKTVSFVFSFEKNDKTIYAHRLWIFSGSLSISLEGASYDKAFGQKAVEHFLPMIEIEDGGSLH